MGLAGEWAYMLSRTVHVCSLPVTSILGWCSRLGWGNNLLGQVLHDSFDEILCVLLGECWATGIGTLDLVQGTLWGLFIILFRYDREGDTRIQ